MKIIIQLLWETIKMNKKTKHWKIGDRVQIGFLGLTVSSISYQNVKYLPNYFILTSDKGKRYIFTPYNGLKTLEEKNVNN